MNLKIPNWFHFDCFLKAYKQIKTIADIKDFNGLKAEHQQLIKDKLIVKIIPLKKPTEPYKANLILNKLKKDEKCAKCNKIVKKVS